tara:strand:+ start:801 stop:2162 length:1362 start_codon:yes stop_codon:yes gene_type:complete
MYNKFKIFFHLLFVVAITSAISGQEREITGLGDDCDNSNQCLDGFICNGEECVGDADVDDDRDGVPNWLDNCPYNVNPGQEDRNNNDIGDACDDDIPRVGLYGSIYRYEFGSSGAIPASFYGIKVRGLNERTIADEFAQYRLRSLPVGEHIIEFYAPMDARDEYFDEDPIFTFPINLTESQVNTTVLNNFLINPTGLINGSVRKEDERIYEDFNAGIVVEFFKDGEMLYRTETNPFGLFESTHMFEGNYTIKASHYLYETLEIQCELVGTRENTCSFQLSLKKIPCSGIDCINENNDQLLKYFKLGDYSGALAYGSKALEEINEKVLEPDYAIFLNNLALIHVRMGESDLADDLYNRALEIMEESFDLEDQHVGALLNNLIKLRESNGNKKESNLNKRRSMRVWGKILFARKGKSLNQKLDYSVEPFNKINNMLYVNENGEVCLDGECYKIDQ